MRSTVSSLRFVANWPSLSASEHASTHPVFDLQRNVCRGEKIWIRHHDGKDCNKVCLVQFLSIISLKNAYIGRTEQECFSYICSLY